MKLLFALVFAGCLSAQSNPFYGPALPNVTAFFQLTEAQRDAILANNAEYNQWAMQKQSRILQVQGEIAEYTAKDPLDPNALGIRYAEIEVNCREIKEKAGEYRAKNVAVLTEAQKVKLAALEEAAKLLPTIMEAQNINLSGTITTAPGGFTSTNTSVSFGTLLGSSAIYGCTAPITARWFDTGDFTRVRK